MAGNPAAFLPTAFNNNAFQTGASVPPEPDTTVRRFAYGWGVVMKHIVHPYHVFTTRY